MDFQVFVPDCKILKIENGVLGEDWFYDFGHMELIFLEHNLLCKFIDVDNLTYELGY
jgi:hypothetical protein